MSIEHARIVVLHIKPEGLPQLMHSLTGMPFSCGKTSLTSDYICTGQ